MATQETYYQSVFLNEVKSIMYVAGDIKTPSAESALIIENTILKHIRDIMMRVADICDTVRGANALSVTDILFLYRKDKPKLRRLVKHIELKSFSRRASSMDEDSGLDYENGKPKKEKFSLDFLSQDDQQELFSDRVDEVQRKRLKSLDSLTRDMSVEEYKEFTEMRQTNFHRNMLRFKEWLNLPAFLPATQTVNQNVYNVLGYLAYDIVMEIVELALLVKRDQEGVPSDTMGSSRTPPSDVGGAPSSVFFNIPSTDSPASNGLTPPTSPKSPVATPSPTLKSRPRKRGRPPKNSVSSANESTLFMTTPTAPPTALQPSHILEAVRRYRMYYIGPNVPLKTYHFSSSSQPSLRLPTVE